MILVGLLIVAAVAGCLGGGSGKAAKTGPSGSDEPASSVVVEPEPGVKVAENRGALKGLVRNDANLSVPKAHVSLVGTGFFTDTNRDGGFLFVNLTAGGYHVFVQASGFYSSEANVTIKTSNVTSVTLFLNPALDSGAGYRPHQHDLWGGESSITLMDEAVDLSTGPSSGYWAYSPYYSKTYCANNNCSKSDDPYWKFTIPEHPPMPPIIFPGTARVEITYGWSSGDATLSKLGLMYRHAGTTKYNFSAPRASGVPFVIETTPEMVDTGHQKFTLWRFAVVADNDLAANAGTRTPAVLLNPIHIKIVIHRGDLIVEPAHEDYWHGKESKLLRNATDTWIRLNAVDTQNRAGTGYGAAPRLIVPPGTNRLHMVFTWKYATAPGVGDFDYTLTWRTAEQHPFYTQVKDYRRAAPAESGDHKKVYDVPLKPEQTDAFYQRYSLWFFLPSQAGLEDTLLTVDKNYAGITFSLEITAFKDPNYR
jgi:hypothetical protein